MNPQSKRRVRFGVQSLGHLLFYRLFAVVASLVLYEAALLAGQQILIPARSVWKYLDNGTDQGTAWIGTNFNDGAWTSGPAELGFGDGGEATVLGFGPDSSNKYRTYYFRKTFVVNNPAVYESLALAFNIDDGAVLYLNEAELARIRMAEGTVTYTNFASGLGTEAWETNIVSALALRAGINTIAVEVHQENPSSADLSFDLRLDGTFDDAPPYVTALDPGANATVRELTFITVTFDAAVAGVSPSDLLVNGQPATNITFISPREYTFNYTQPATGLVQVAWASNHGITDTSPLSNSFAGGSWTYTLDPTAPINRLVISEFMALNQNGIRDEDGDRSDWIELRNLGPLDQDLGGWFLTDEPTNLTKWQFPSVTLGANQYLLVWASGKDRRDPAAPLHTDFRLAGDGDYLALIDPGTNIVSEFAPFYPSQRPDISYGRDVIDQDRLGYFETPTPRAQNAISGGGFAPELIFSIPGGVYTNNSLTVGISAPSGVVIRYTTNGSLPTATSPVYAGPLTFTNNLTIKARAFPTNSSVWPSRVVSRSFVLLDSSARDFRSNLPLIIASTEGRPIQDGPRTLGTLVVIDTVQGQSSLTAEPQFLGLAEFEIVGQTRVGFPKQPLRIEIQDELRNDLDVPLLGMPADADWRLQNPYTEKSLMNDFLACELFEQMGQYSVRRRFVEVFRDSGGGKLSYPADYHGVMILFETIKIAKERVDIAKLSSTSSTNEPTITGGYIVKLDKNQSTGNPDLIVFTSPRVDSSLGIKLHDPKPREVNNSTNHPQARWIRTYLTQMERVMYTNSWLTATATNHYSHYLDVDNWVDQHWIGEFTKEVNAYRLSNFIHKDRGGKLKMAPIWDWNLSFGNADYLEGGRTNGWLYALLGEPQHIWLRRLINGDGGMGDPDFNQKIADRWSVLRTNILNGSRVNGRIHEIASFLSEAAQRDFEKYPRLGTYVWPNPPGNPPNASFWHVNYWAGISSYSQIISNMQWWVMGRYNWIDAQFTRRPEFDHPGGQVAQGHALSISTPPGPGATVYYTLDGTDPRASGGGVRPGAMVYSGPITITTNIRVFARALSGGAWQNTWSGPNETTFYTALPGLRITEIMYHPQDPIQPSPYLDEDFEYLELKNIGETPLNLRRFRISGGVNVELGNVTLPSGAYAVVVANTNAFRSRYGSGPLIVGSYTNRLANGGERIVLEGSMREPIHDFHYDDEWYPITDGHGFSLVIRNEADSLSTWPHLYSWRASGQIGGSPGAPESIEPIFAPVVINEIVTADPDAIEFHNLGPVAADISGWFVTDDFRTPRKFTLPPETIVPANGYFVFHQSAFGSRFNLSHLGGEVYLFSGNGSDLTGYLYGFKFGASPSGASFGRHIVSTTGEEHFPIQSAITLGSSNAGPLVGPVVISEINYHPVDVVAGGVVYDNTEDEYIELHNSGGTLARLHDPSHPANTWRLSGAVEFSFPENTSIPAGGYLLVVSFDPANAQKLSSFTSANPVPPGTLIVGPYSGNLDNDGDRVELLRPGAPEPNGAVPYILVERVEYRDEQPWPAAADGIGPSLQRIAVNAYGDDPANWTAAGRSPGAPFGGGPPPVIIAHPTDLTVIAGQTATFRVEASGGSPLSYQWRHNRQSIYGATSATLVILNTRITRAGQYDVVVMNATGSALSSVATLTVLLPPSITEEPADVTVGGNTNAANFGQTGMDAVFRAAATSQQPPITYQWRFNGNPIPGATSSVLTIQNADFGDDGHYDVLVTDRATSVQSRAARLAIHIRPFYTEPFPLSRTLAVGSTFNLSVGARGAPMPLHYNFRRGSTNYVRITTNSFVATLTIPAVQFSDAGTYSAAVSNSYPIVTSSNSASSISRLAYLAVVGPPSDQIVPIGSNAAFRASVRSSIISQFRYQWFFNGSLLPGQTFTNLFITNVQPHHAGIYTLAVTNNAVTNVGYASPLVTTFDALLSTPEPDSDQDGLPDWFEDRYNLANGANDAGVDADGDGLRNIDEYRAGTDPRDALSYLRIDISREAVGVLIEFMAVSNKSYSLLYRHRFEDGSWLRLQDFGLTSTSRIEHFYDPADAGQRYYRLITPRGR